MFNLIFYFDLKILRNKVWRFSVYIEKIFLLAFSIIDRSFIYFIDNS